MIGAFFVPILDRFGRLTGIRISIVSAIIGCVLQSVSFYLDSYVLLLIGRLIFGIQMGIGMMCYPIYLTEIAPLGKGPMFSFCFGIFLTFGVVLCMVAGLEWIFGNVQRWNWMLMSPLVIYGLQGFFSFWAVESPIWLRSCGKVGKARHAEEKLYRVGF